MNSLLNLLVIIVVFGVVVGFINRFLPMPAIIKSLLNIVVFAILLIYILQYFGLIPTILPMMQWIPLKGSN